MSSNSSYQNFIINKLNNTASKTDIDSLIVFDEENNLTSGKFKTLFETMGLTETVEDRDDNGNVVRTRVKGKRIVETDASGNIRTDGSGHLNTIQGSISSIESRVSGIQESIQNLTTRIELILSTAFPVITLLGHASINILHGSTYTDAGATATDYADGDLTSSIVVGGLPDTNIPDEYIITYNVTNSAGNAATEVTRTVSVVVVGTFYFEAENRYLGAAHNINGRPG